MKNITLLLLMLALHCATTNDTPDTSFSFDEEKSRLQQQIEVQRYYFYIDKHKPELKHELVLPGVLLYRSVALPSSVLYRLRIQPDGRVSYQLMSPVSSYYAALCESEIKKLRFEPSWLGKFNYESQLDILFTFRFEEN